MLRMLLAAAAAFSLAASQPAFACPDCKDCPHHKGAAEKADRNAKPASCDCTKGECKCAPNCGCTHCQKKAAEKKDEKKT